ncbi:Uncharacterised protein [uncultured archaeon]|nr:Uncharacterised protein [uncultured archaeon]
MYISVLFRLTMQYFLPVSMSLYNRPGLLSGVRLKSRTPIDASIFPAATSYSLITASPEFQSEEAPVNWVINAIAAQNATLNPVFIFVTLNWSD